MAAVAESLVCLPRGLLLWYRNSIDSTSITWISEHSCQAGCFIGLLNSELRYIVYISVFYYVHQDKTTRLFSQLAFSQCC